MKSNHKIKQIKNSIKSKIDFYEKGLNDVDIILSDIGICPKELRRNVNGLKLSLRIIERTLLEGGIKC